MFRTAHAGEGANELERGLNPAHFNPIPGETRAAAHVGSESVARDFLGRSGYEDFYTEFRMHPDFDTEFAAHRSAYDGGDSGRFEYVIPQNMIGRFNELTISRIQRNY